MREGLVLMTRRALTKRTWPGVWTNACCGHPSPVSASRTRSNAAWLTSSVPAPQRSHRSCPDFRYEAVDASGIRENEVCPVFVATLVGGVDPDPAEVMEFRWVDPGALADVATHSPWLLSPWSVEQITQMDLRSLGHSLVAAAAQSQLSSSRPTSPARLPSPRRRWLRGRPPR